MFDVILQMLSGKLVEGYMPMQMLGEMGGLAILFIWSFYLLDKKMGIKVNKLAQDLSAHSLQRPGDLRHYDSDRDLHVGVLHRSVVARLPKALHRRGRCEDSDDADHPGGLCRAVALPGRLLRLQQHEAEH